MARISSEAGPAPSHLSIDDGSDPGFSAALTASRPLARNPLGSAPPAANGGGVPAATFLLAPQVAASGTAPPVATSGAVGLGGISGANGCGASGQVASTDLATNSDTSPIDNAIDNSQYSSPADLQKWEPLVAGLPPDQREAAEKALNRPIAAAKMLRAGGKDAKAAQAFLDANPAVKAALDTAAHGGKADGKISKHDISSFISTMQKQLGAAKDTLNTYQKANPNVDGQSLELVRQVALLQAGLPLTNAADPSVQADGDKATGMTTRTGLQAIANANPGLSSALKNAANLFAQPGMFTVLDQGGLDGVGLATHSADGKFNQDNITGWVKKQAPTTGGEFAALIGDVATRGAVTGIDTSNLNGDIFKNPKNYSGPQKAAALVQLQTTRAQVEAGSSLRKTSDTEAELQQRIDQLQADPDVSAFLRQAVPQSEASIINSDPSLAAAVQKRYVNDILTGRGLKSDLARVDADNAKKTDPNAPKESDAGALSDFSSELTLQSDLHGGKAPTLQQVVGSSSTLTRRLQSDYVRDFSNGGEIKQLLSVKGAKPTDAMSAVQADEQSFESALDPNFVQSQSDRFISMTTALLQPALIKSGSSRDVLAGLGGGPAGLDEISQSVAASLSQQGHSPLSQADTQALINSFLHDLKNGASLQDALAKYDPTSKSFDASASAGGAATLLSVPAAAPQVHAVLAQVASSALLLNAQAHGGDAAEGSKKERTEKAMGYATYGLMAAEVPSGIAASIYQKAAKKAAKAAESAETPAEKATNEALAEAAAGKSAVLAGARDVLGAAGGVLTAALTLPSVHDLIKAGQHWEAALSVGAGARGIYAVTSTTIDMTRFAASRLAGSQAKYASGAVSKAIAKAAGRVVGSVAGEAAGMATAETVGAVAGPAGWIMDGVLGVAFIFTAIAEAVKKAHEKKSFDQTVDPTLDQYGITKPK